MEGSGIDISVIVPCRNEEGYIRQAIRRLTAQEGAGTEFQYEIFIVDGMSTDATRNIIEEESVRDPRVRLLLNEKKITPSAFNLGIRKASGRYICILGAHAEVSEDYLRCCLETMRKTDADNVGGPWKAKGKAYIGEAVALAFQSPFAVGAAKSRRVDYEGYVDSVWGGFYKRDVFARIGLFDEDFVRNQDDELNLRLVKLGGKIWQSPSIRYDYFCRDRLSLLWRQYLQYGYWKVRVIRKHHIPAAPRHLVPGAFLLTLLALVVASPFAVFFRVALLVLLGVYAAGLVAGALSVCGRSGNFSYLPIVPIIFAIFHLSYGFGFLKGINDSLLRRNSGKAFITMTR